jgi:hypothetical protein
MKRTLGIGGAALLLIMAGFCQLAAAGEDTTITAFAVWQGKGQTYQTGPKEATFSGALSGVMYAETEKGPIGTGQMVCPTLVKIELESGRQTGSGQCTITAKDNAHIYAEIACKGVYLVGCDGEFKLTGGDGRFAGIRGGGTVIIRSDVRQIAPVSEMVAQEQGTGISLCESAALHASVMLADSRPMRPP